MVDFFIDLSGIFGDSDSITDKAKIFKKELELINEKYSDFFRNRKSSSENQVHDNIFNHCKTYLGFEPVKFDFTDNIVPEHIKKECFDAFKKVFK